MRIGFPSCLLPLFLALGAGLFSCESTTPGPATRKESARVEALCAPRAAALQLKVRSLLMGALEGGGPTLAFDACATQAPRLLELESQAEIALAFKRVARRPLNPANSPDPWERLALEHYEQDQLAGRQWQRPWVQRLEAEGHRRYRYYEAIVAGAPCLACHGEARALADSVRSRLVRQQRETPGLQEGQLLGLLRVEVDADDLP